MKQNGLNKIEYLGRIYELSDSISDTNRQFENTLIQKQRKIPQLDSGIPIELGYYHQTKWLECCETPFLLVQAKDATGASIGQVAIQIFRPRNLKWFGYASIPSMKYCFTSIDEEYLFFKALPEILKQIKNITRLVIRGWRDNPNDLWNFDAITRRANLQLSAPENYTRTLLLDLNGSEEEFFARFKGSTRQKYRHPSKERILIRKINNRSEIPKLQEALNASFNRSISKNCPFDYHPYFTMAEKYPESTLILGLSFKEKPEDLLAYSLAINHGSTVEILSVGSVNNDELRKMPFTYYLFYETFLWAKSLNCKFADLGGITDQGVDDPTSSITRFKRNFTENALEVSREVSFDLKPTQTWIFQKLKQFGDNIRQ